MNGHGERKLIRREKYHNFSKYTSDPKSGKYIRNELEHWNLFVPVQDYFALIILHQRVMKNNGYRRTGKSYAHV